MEFNFQDEIKKCLQDIKLYWSDICYMQNVMVDPSPDGVIDNDIVKALGTMAKMLSVYATCMNEIYAAAGLEIKTSGININIKKTEKKNE